MRLACAIAIVALSQLACAASHDLFNMRMYPAFVRDRVERVGEPFSIVSSEVRTLQTLRLEDRRLVQGMPIFMVRRTAKWLELAGKVRVPSAFQESRQPMLKTFVIGTVTSDDKTKQATVELPSLPEELRTVGDPVAYLEQRQTEFLGRLDQDVSVRGAPMMLVCLPTQKPESKADEKERCFESGGEYLALLAPVDTLRPVAVYPFRLERRNGLLGFVGGISLITAGILASVW
ncbi:MAG: hypothetical protein ABIY52_03215 [Gemmatimonadaceae bacterium]